LAPVPVHDDAPVAVAVKDEGFEPEAEVAEEPAAIEDAPKAKRVRKAKTEEKS